MSHPRTRAERRVAKRKEFNRKYFLSQNAGYPAPYFLTYARNKGRRRTLHTKAPVDYDFKVPGEYKDYYSWRGKYRAEKIYFRQLGHASRYPYFKRKANQAVRRSKNFSTRKSNDYRKVYEYAWMVD